MCAKICIFEISFDKFISIIANDESSGLCNRLDSCSKIWCLTYNGICFKHILLIHIPDNHQTGMNSNSYINRDF